MSSCRAIGNNMKCSFIRLLARSRQRRQPTIDISTYTACTWICVFSSWIGSAQHCVRELTIARFVYSFSYAFIKICNISDGTIYTLRTLFLSLTLMSPVCLHNNVVFELITVVIIISFVIGTRWCALDAFFLCLAHTSSACMYFFLAVCVCVLLLLIWENLYFALKRAVHHRITVGFIHISNQSRKNNNAYERRENGKMKTEPKNYECVVFIFSWLPVSCKVERVAIL